MPYRTGRTANPVHLSPSPYRHRLFLKSSRYGTLLIGGTEGAIQARLIRNRIDAPGSGSGDRVGHGAACWLVARDESEDIVRSKNNYKYMYRGPASVEKPDP